MRDVILLQGIQVPAALGVTAAERRMRRPVLLDLEIARVAAPPRVVFRIVVAAIVETVLETIGIHAIREARVARRVPVRIGLPAIARIAIRIRHLVLRIVRADVALPISWSPHVRCSFHTTWSARKERRRSYELDFTGIGISDFRQTGDGRLVSLPKASLEVRAIRDRLDRLGQTRILVESEGTPPAFSKGASDSRILHLASHSKISESDPLFSTIYLHPGDGPTGQEHSGQLFAYQLFGMNLRNDLIMLNSCESATGEYFQGAGIMGISRALRYAGAQSLVLNSWQVEDQLASDFAVGFYAGLSQGLTKPEALREAKIEFLKNRNANPHYWGAYILNGDPRPVVDDFFAAPVFAFTMIFLFGGLVFTGIWLLRIRNRKSFFHFTALYRAWSASR